MRISDWSSDVCSSDLARRRSHQTPRRSIAPAEASTRGLCFLGGAQRMCVSLRETRREYVHVGLSSASMPPTVSRRATHILSPPPARRHASGTCSLGACRSIDPPDWLRVVAWPRPRLDQIGRASCWERVCQYVSSMEV